MNVFEIKADDVVNCMRVLDEDEKLFINIYPYVYGGYRVTFMTALQRSAVDIGPCITRLSAITSLGETKT